MLQQYGYTDIGPGKMVVKNLSLRLRLLYPCLLQAWVFLVSYSKAHIEQTSASEESVAQVQRIDTEISRLTAIIDLAEDKIKKLENSGTGADANIQAQIDKEQERIDKAFERIEPAIQQQNKIIEDARATDNNRTKSYEDQLTNIQNEITRLENTAREYEDKIAGLGADTSAVQPLLEQIKKIEEEIIRVTNPITKYRTFQIRAGLQSLESK